MKLVSKIACLLVLPLALAACSTGSNDNADDPQSSLEKLNIGTYATVPPLMYMEEDGKTLVGLNFDLMEEVGKRLKMDVVWHQMQFPSVIPGIQSSKIDAAIGLIDDTAERREAVDFVDYIASGTALLVPKGNPQNIQTLGDLCGKSVAVLRGSTQIGLTDTQSSECTAAGKSALEVLQYDTPADMRLQVKSGKVHATFGNAPLLEYLAVNSDNGQTFDAVTREQYGIAKQGILFSKDNQKLRDAVHAVMEEIWNDGTYLTMATKHGVAAYALEFPTINDEN